MPMSFLSDKVTCAFTQESLDCGFLQAEFLTGGNSFGSSE